MSEEELLAQPVEDLNRMSIVICSFPIQAYDSFKLLRNLPTNVELMYLIDVSQLAQKDTHLILNNFIYRGHDIGLQVKATGNIERDREDYFVMFEEAKASIRVNCGYQIRFIGINSMYCVNQDVLKAAKMAQLHVFEYLKHGKYGEPKIFGVDLLSSWEMKILTDHIHMHAKEGFTILSIPDYHQMPALNYLDMKRLQIVMSGIPKCKYFRRFVKGLLKRTNLKCYVLVDLKSCTKKKKLKKFKKAFKLGVIPIYSLDSESSTDLEMTVREIEVGVNSFRRLAKGRAVMNQVFVQDPLRAKALQKRIGGAEISVRSAALVADGRISPKAVKMYMASLRPDSTVLLQVKTASDHTDCNNLKEILLFLSESVDFKQ